MKEIFQKWKLYLLKENEALADLPDGGPVASTATAAQVSAAKKAAQEEEIRRKKAQEDQEAKRKAMLMRQAIRLFGDPNAKATISSGGLPPKLEPEEIAIMRLYQSRDDAMTKFGQNSPQYEYWDNMINNAEEVLKYGNSKQILRVWDNINNILMGVGSAASYRKSPIAAKNLLNLPDDPKQLNLTGVSLSDKKDAKSISKK